MEYQSQKKRPQQVGTLMSLLRPCKFLPGRPTYLKLPLANNNSANKNSENTLDMIGYLEHLRADRKRRRQIVKNMPAKKNKNKNENNSDQSKGRLIRKSYTCYYKVLCYTSLILQHMQTVAALSPTYQLKQKESQYIKSIIKPHIQPSFHLES